MMPGDAVAFPLILVLAALYSFTRKDPKKFNPVGSGKITSSFGERINPVTKKKEHHNGIDIAVPEGTPVSVPAPGEVVSVNENPIGGLQVIVKHRSGVITGYSHLSKSLVKLGDAVRPGDPIALSGRTGQVTGAHLHFSVRDKAGKYLDPAGAIVYA